jgi:predicted ABC-type ATPase
VIARELSGDNPDRAAIAAGRVMLTRLRELADQRVSFAFETTLASRSFAPWLRDLSGYDVQLVFLWLPSAEFALDRVADRVRMGGHNVPADTVRRRYRTGLLNFFDLYMPMASAWRLYDGSSPSPRLIAESLASQPVRVYDGEVWQVIRRQGTP